MAFPLLSLLLDLKSKGCNVSISLSGRRNYRVTAGEDDEPKEFDHVAEIMRYLKNKLDQFNKSKEVAPRK